MIQASPNHLLGSMRVSSSFVSIVALGLVVSFASGCSSGMAAGNSAGVPQPRDTTPPTPVASAADNDWTIQKPLTGREIKCTGGKAKVFDCQNTDLLSFLPVGMIGGGELSGVWGWIDSTTKREFAIVGRSNGTAFIEVTDPVNPKYLGNLPVHAGARPAIWRDMKVYKNYAFVVSDAAGRHGMQIFDLTQLRNVKNPPVEFQETGHYDKVASVHTIALNEATGFAYNAGSNGGGENCGGGLHMVDVRNPLQPVFAGCHSETLGGKRQRGYIHEPQCVIYRGPDQQYRDREICLNSAEAAVGIVDVTDKQQPKTISVATYPNARYTHQGWLTDDHRYFFVNDELDDGIGGINKTRTIVFDLNDLDEPVVQLEYYGTTPATDHNLYIRGRYMYQSNYSAGLRIADVSDPKAPKEVSYFDVFPTGNEAGFVGTWTNYPFFSKDGIVAVTSINEGIFLVRHRLAGQ